jgi:hypothetical protein
MDHILFIAGIIAGIGALDLFIVAALVFYSKNKNLQADLDREYGPELELYENGVRLKSRHKKQTQYRR